MISAALRRRRESRARTLRIMHCRSIAQASFVTRPRMIEHVRTTYVPRFGACDRLVHQSIVLVPAASTVGIMVPLAGKAAPSTNPVHRDHCGAHRGVTPPS